VDKHVSLGVWELMYFGNPWEVIKDGMLLKWIRNTKESYYFIDSSLNYFTLRVLTAILYTKIAS
jgi:hypothetical protein